MCQLKLRNAWIWFTSDLRSDFKFLQALRIDTCRWWYVMLINTHSLYNLLHSRISQHFSKASVNLDGHVSFTYIVWYWNADGLISVRWGSSSIRNSSVSAFPKIYLHISIFCGISRSRHYLLINVFIFVLTCPMIVCGITAVFSFFLLCNNTNYFQ